MSSFLHTLVEAYLIIAFLSFLFSYYPNRISAEDSFWKAVTWPSTAYQYIISENN